MASIIRKVTGQDPTTKSRASRRFPDTDRGRSAADAYSKGLIDAGTVYEVRVRISGRQVSKTFSRKSDARNYASAIETDRNRGVAVDPRSGRVTFEDYSTRWLNCRHDLRPRTRDDYDSLLKVHLIPTFGRHSLTAITPSVVRNWHSRLSQDHPARAAKGYRLLRTILGTAVVDRYLVMNPCQVKGAGVERAVEREIPNLAEVDALARAMPANLSALVLVAAWCGLRRGELLGLTRVDLDPLHGTLKVARSVSELADGSISIGEPKTAAGRRTVAVPPHLLPVIEAHLGTYVGFDPDAPIFASAVGGWLRPRALERQWARARSAVRVKYTLHDLRHLAATMTATTGASTKEIMARIGHASPAAALRYQHATEDRDKAIANALSGLASAPVPLRSVG
jgi:integrase